MLTLTYHLDQSSGGRPPQNAVHTEPVLPLAGIAEPFAPPALSIGPFMALAVLVLAPLELKHHSLRALKAAKAVQA